MLAHDEPLSQSLSAIRIACDILDANVSLTVATQMDQACRSGKQAILIDLGAPSRCVGSGLAGLIESCARLSASMRIGLCNLGDPVLRQLRDYGLDRAFAVFDSVETAVLARLFTLCRPVLLTVNWFRRLYEAFGRFKYRLFHSAPWLAADHPAGDPTQATGTSTSRV